jgi:titin
LPIPNLTIGETYEFRVTAKNVLGAGVSTIAEGMPTSVPAAPTGLVANAGNRQADLFWQSPANTGGLPILEYEVQYRTQGVTSWQSMRSSGTNTRVQNLLNGEKYEFRVAAVNDVGVGSFSEIAGPETIGLLLPPTGITAIPGDGRIDLNWEAVDEGGLPVLSEYVVEYRAASETTWTKLTEDVVNDLKATIPNLVNATPYQLRIASRNSSGQGKFSSVIDAEPFRLPGVISDLTVAANIGQATLAWRAPAETGGVPILDYVVEFKQEGSSDWSLYNDGIAAATNAVVSSLVTGQQYRFRVAAATRFGLSEFLSTDAVTIGTPPNAPSRVLAWKEDAGVLVGWNEPASGDSVGGYRVDYRRVGGSWVSAGSTTNDSLLISSQSFTRGISYEFRVAAVAGTGISSYSLSPTVLY